MKRLAILCQEKEPELELIERILQSHVRKSGIKESLFGSLIKQKDRFGKSSKAFRNDKYPSKVL